MLKYFLYTLLLIFLVVFSCDRQNYRQGELLYLNKCANCHMEEGLGLGQLIPPLAGSDWVRDNQNELACIIRNGMEGEVTVNGQVFNQPMAAIPELSDIEITNIINYINHSWGNKYGYMKFDEVRESLKKCTQ